VHKMRQYLECGKCKVTINKALSAADQRHPTSKAIDLGVNRKRICDFLLVIINMLS